MAAIAASLMCCGVEKCGSPAPNSTRSAPVAFNLAASATTAMVADISIRLTRSLNCFVAGTVAIFNPHSDFNLAALKCAAMEFFSQPLLHYLRHQSAYRASELEYFLDQPGAQVRIGFRGE